MRKSTKINILKVHYFTFEHIVIQIVFFFLQKYEHIFFFGNNFSKPILLQKFNHILYYRKSLN